MEPSHEAPLMIFKPTGKDTWADIVVLAFMYLVIGLILFYIFFSQGHPFVSIFFGLPMLLSIANETRRCLCIIRVYNDMIEIAQWGNLLKKRKHINLSDIRDVTASWPSGKSNSFVLTFNLKATGEVKCRHALYCEELTSLFTFLREKNIPVDIEDERKDTFPFFRK